MKRSQIGQKIHKQFQQFKNHRKISAIIIVLLVFSILISIGLINVISNIFRIPDFNLKSFQITKKEENSIYANLSLNLSRPVSYSISVEKIECQLYQQNPSEEKILAEGRTLSSIKLSSKKTNIDDVSFIFEIPDFQDLFNALFSKGKVGIKGKITLPLGFTTSFNRPPDEVNFNAFPKLSIYEIYPIPPGSCLEIIIGVNNSHKIPFYITKGECELYSQAYGALGEIFLENISLLPGFSNVSLSLHSDIPQLTWMFERVLNNGSIQVQMSNLNATIIFAEEIINVNVNEGSDLLWDSFQPGLQVHDLANISIIDEKLLKFDVVIDFLGRPLWGYNITPSCGRTEGISFDFYHKSQDNESYLVGNGSTNITVNVNRLEHAYVIINVNIFPTAALEMISFWIINRKIEIDIRNGIICLEFYDISFQVRFEYHI